MLAAILASTLWIAALVVFCISGWWIAATITLVSPLVGTFALGLYWRRQDRLDEEGRP